MRPACSSPPPVRRAARRPLLAIVAGRRWPAPAWVALAAGCCLPAGIPPRPPRRRSPPAALGSESDRRRPRRPPRPRARPRPPRPTAGATPSAEPDPDADAARRSRIEQRRAALSATLATSAGDLRHPGHLGGDDLSRRHELARARPASPTSASHRAVTADTAFAAGSISKTFTRGADPAPRRGRQAVARRPGHRPTCRSSSSIPTITVRQLLDHTSGLDDFFSHPAIDTALLAQPRRVWSAADSLALRRQAVLQAGHRLALLEHQLPGPRHGRRGGRPGAAGQPAPDAASSIRSGWATRSTRRSRSRVDRSPTATASAAPSPKLKGIDVSRRHRGHPVHLGRHRIRRRRLDRHDRLRPRALGARAVRRHRAAPGDARVDGRRRGRRRPRSSRASRTASASRS